MLTHRSGWTITCAPARCRSWTGCGGWHETEFRNRSSFAYTVVTHDESRVLGCVYVYADADADASVWLWVRHDAYEVDATLEQVVRDWIERDWPFTRVAWPRRERG